jgi:hypothetical protein
MNMNDKPFADWSWKNKQQAAPMQNTIAPLGSGSMEQAPPAMQQGPGPLESIAQGAATKGMVDAVNQGYKGMMSAPLGVETSALGSSMGNTLAAEGMAGAVGSGAATSAGSQAAMLAAQNAGFGAAAPLAAAETATALGAGATGAATGAAGTAAATGAAGAGAGATAALAAMGPVGWAGLGLMGGKALGLFNDGTTNVPKGYMNGTPQVGGK